eukprot:6417308-Alexandrium_andersonii.AAC.1
MSGSDMEWGLWPSQMACHPRLAASLAWSSAWIASAIRPCTSSMCTPLQRSLRTATTWGGTGRRR